jgi:hypothetical protein
MQRKRHSSEQIIRKLREAEVELAWVVCRFCAGLRSFPGAPPACLESQIGPQEPASSRCDIMRQLR